MISPQQYRKLMKHYRLKNNISQSATKAGVDQKTASKYVKGAPGPEERRGARHWRTHPDIFGEVWLGIEEALFREPDLQAKVLFEQLLEQEPGKFTRQQRRSFERRVRAWKRRYGAEPELFFSQEHKPGDRLQLDWMYCDSLEIEIGGQRLEHLLVHVVLPYSNWEWARVCYSESYLSLKRGLQSALVELGGSPRFCQTDQSSTATHVRGRSEGQRSGREYNARYLGLLAHYGLEPAVIGVGEPHENGDVESGHGHLRTAIDQALRLAGSRQFASVAQYEAFLFGLLRKRNASRGERCERERSTLRVLPPTRWPEYDEEVLSVSREALCRVGKQAYSVPARYAGERLRVRIWETELEFVWNGEVVERTERRRGKPGVFINWRHVIGALLRKPGALKGWRYREAMFPNRRWRTLYDLLTERHSPGRAEREYLGILALGLEHRLETLEAAIEELGDQVSLDTMRRSFCPPPNNIVEMALEVDLRAYDELLSQQSSQIANQEVA
jgi:transposase